MTLADSRKALLAMHAEGRRDQFLDLGFRYLAEVEDDARITLHVLNALVDARLGGPARELLADRRILAAAGMDTGELARALEPVPDGLVPWEQTDKVFEANLEALLPHRDHLRDVATELRIAHEAYELHRSSDGQLHLSRREPGHLRRWLGSFHDPAGATDLATPLGPSGPAATVIGTGVSCLVDRVYAATRPIDGAGSVPVFVIDDSLVRVAAWLRTLDRTPMLADPRLCLFAGPRAMEQFERFLALNEDIAPAAALLSPPWASELGREAAQVIGRIKARRQQAMIELAGRHQRRAAQRTVADWIGRLRPGATILGFTSRSTTMLQYSMRDIGHAFEEHGYRFKLLIERESHRIHTTLTTSRAVYENDPALIVLINHFRCEQTSAMGATPVLSWNQDPAVTVLSKETGASIGPLDFVCGYYHERCTTEFGYPDSRFFITSLPVSTRTFHDGAVPSDDAARYACDLMYVGHLHADAEAHLAHWRRVTPPHLHPLLDAVRDEATALNGRGEHIAAPWPIVQRLAADLHLDLDEAAIEDLSNYFAYRLYDIIYRRETLGWAAEWASRTGRVFKLYGRGWANDPVLGRYAAGPIEHGEPLRRAYRCATLALQTIPGGFKHQRAYEALASGCTVLGRHVPPDFVDTGSAQDFPTLDRVVFRDARELADLAERFLGDEELRREVHGEFVEVVHRKFTYKGVVGDLIGKIRGAPNTHSSEGTC